MRPVKIRSAGGPVLVIMQGRDEPSARPATNDNMHRPNHIFCKFSALCLWLGLALNTARADLILEQQSVDTNGTARIVLKLHGGKMRMDETDSKGGNFSVIADLQTHDALTLLPATRQYLRRTGLQVQRQIEAALKTAGPATNEISRQPDLPRDTGRAESVEHFQAEVYTWSGAYGLSKTLWVATNFPNYASIRRELAQIDHYNVSGPHRNAQPEVARLPGMVVRSQNVVRGNTNVTTLVSVKQEPLDPSLFELPPGYTLWQPARPAATVSNVPAAGR
jgi:hypothetical protein